MTVRLEQRFEGDEVMRQQRMESSVAPARREWAQRSSGAYCWGSGGGEVFSS